MTQDNIKSSTVELGFELAKEFLKKLISPSVEELGLLLSDKIKYLRFRNQVAILNKAENLVKQKGIRIKEIPVKILVPLLENASLEEDKDLQSNWAKMVANLADSKSNLQNQIFPYLLSQISKEELNGLREILVMEDEQITNINRVNELFNREDVENYEREESHLRTKVNLNEQKGFLCYLELFQYFESFF